MRNLIHKCYVQASLAVLIPSVAFAASSSGYDDHGAAGHAKTEGLPQLDPSWYASQLFWLAVVFIILYMLFAKKVLPELSSTIDVRNERIQGDLEEAEKLKNEAEKVHQAYEEILEEARQKSADAFVKSDEAIKKKTESAMSKFREKSLSKTQEAESAVAKAKKTAMKDMDNIAAEVAREAAEKIIGVSTDIKQAKSVVENISKKAA